MATTVLVNFLRSFSSTVTIPKRIKRGPTDLLKALVATVIEDDTSGGAYKYHDDPYLIPASNETKRTWALAKEAGRRAARHLASEWPTLFMYDEDFPRMPAFRPQKKPLEEDGDTEEILKDRMNRFWVENAAAVYRNIRAKGGEISRETQVTLLEFLCFYNCEHENKLNLSEWDEERWYRNFLRPDNEMRSQWKTGGDAEVLFEEIEPKDSQVYSALIAGLCRYLQGPKGYELLLEMRGKGLIPSVEAYNGAIKACYHLAQTHDARWQKALGTIHKIA